MFGPFKNYTPFDSNICMMITRQGVETGKLGAFELWDSPKYRDIVLRRQFDSGEEVVVSALLQQEPIEDADDDIAFPRGAMAKVCITKPRLSSLLEFSCNVTLRLA